MPTVSVIIPTYNTERFIGEAIRSVLQQTYTDFELIIIDDGSTDTTRAVLDPFLADARVRYVYQENQGLPGARNTGIRESRGAFIAFLDADDLWTPEKLAQQVAAFQMHPEVSIVYCNYTNIDEHGNDMPFDTLKTRRHNTLYEDLLYDNVVAGSGSAVLIRAECFHSVGLFDEHLVACEDLDMWRRLALDYQFLLLEPVMVQIRVHRANMQGNLDRMAKGLMQNLQNMRLDVPRAYRWHLPYVARELYFNLFFHYFVRRRYWQSCVYIAQIALLGPRQWVLLSRDLWRLSVRYRARQHRGGAVIN